MATWIDVRRRRRLRVVSRDPACDAADAPGERPRGVRERLREFVDPPESRRDPSALTRLLESARAFTRTHVQATDSALAFIVFAVCLRNAEMAYHSLPAALFTFLLVAPLVWRRRAPIVVFLVIAAVAFAQWLANLQLLADIALLGALYAVAADRPQRVALAGTFVLEGGAVIAVVRWPHGDSAFSTIALLSGLIVASLVSGLYVRERRAHVESLVGRAARLEFERDQQARLAAAAERARISRETHDVMAHSLAVVIALANGATAKLARDPRQSRQALESISELGRQALADTRRLLSVLRTEDGADVHAPQPGIEQITDLVDRAASTGLAARFTVRGDPLPVAPGLALSAYRIVQEALTNTVKHAQAATTVAVELTWAPHHLEITVSDDGHDATQSTGPAIGFGLTGMRERAALYGGTAAAGLGCDGGWIVTAALPITNQGAP